MNNADDRQLQLWNEGKKTYEHVPYAPLTPDAARLIADGRPWRIAKSNRALKPKYQTPRATALESRRSRREVQLLYIQWAVDHNVHTISQFAEYPVFAKQFFKEIKTVNIDNYFAVNEETIDE